MKIKRLFYDMATYYWKGDGDLFEIFQTVSGWYDAFITNPNGRCMQTLLNKLKNSSCNGDANAEYYYEELSKMIRKESDTNANV